MSAEWSPLKTSDDDAGETAARGKAFTVDLLFLIRLAGLGKRAAFSRQVHLGGAVVRAEQDDGQRERRQARFLLHGHVLLAVRHCLQRNRRERATGNDCKA